MNKMTVKSALFALMTSAVLLAPTVSAENGSNQGQGYHEMRGEHRGHHGDMRKMFRGLDLTEQQRTEIKSLMKAHKSERAAQRPSAEVRQAHQQQMLDLISSDSFSEADVLNMMDARQEKRQQAAVERVKMQRAIYQLLTPEQQAKFKANFAQRVSRKGDRS
ncbi:hypothetical protein TUM4644_14770 [Shewanella colwelliana]|uniref:Spy/CpxP family protein refolding chaperone n=1 Tax=Shewanella colwelliana TaxID=23 RepID=UPI001BB9EDCC|nr:Spy/CpxP family protein refolding chaperone [Shewanella colwelliana]GIU22520.1 hypothetical protein TUM4644_14770 [Shewanella colwelliana]